MSQENNFVNAVERIEPNDSLRGRVLSLTEQPVKRRKRPVLKYAVSFVLVASVFAGGALCWPMQPVRKDVGSLSVAVPQTGFNVVADAATTSSASHVELKPGRAFQIADETGGTNDTEEGHSRNGQKKQEMMGIAGFRLKCVGNDIEKVTYQTNRGAFQKLVRLNAFQKAYRDAFQKLPNANLQWATPDSVYSPAGVVQEVSPDSDGMLYLKVQETVTDLTSDEIENDLKFTTKIQKRLFDGTEIKIDVLFRNGTQSEKTVKLTFPDQEPGDSGYITATLLK